MEKFKLIKPTIEYKSQAIEFIQENYDYNSNINGVGGLDRYLKNSTYEKWLEKLEEDRNRVADEEKVPAETFFLVRENDNKIIGMINIRLVLNKRLREHSGNIGYSVRPTERRKGYNKINLYLALLECQKHNMEKVMLDCDKSNLGSAKTIQALGGILEKEYYDEKSQETIQVYWIDVNESIKINENKYKKTIAFYN